MNKIFLKKTFLLVLCIVWFCGCQPIFQIEERFFDTAEFDHEDVRIAIFYPSVGSIKSLVELKKIGFLQIDQITVIGVYHENECTDYNKAKEFVKEKKLDWIKFHHVIAPLSKYAIFQKNACTSEFETIFKKSDGIIFFGGADIPPYIYGSKTNLLTYIQTPYRHFLELSCVFHLLGGLQDTDFQGFLESKPEFPVLGICLGCQSLNVGTGGTLTQDVWSEVYENKYFEDVVELGKENWHTNPLARLYPEKKLLPYNMHPVKLNTNSKFCNEMGFDHLETPYILSAHHQMAGKLGKDIKIAATSLDGKVVEAIEHEKFPNVLGVQFHPEFPILWDYKTKFRFTPEEEVGKSLGEILEENPPSLAFHQKIWSWFSQKVKEFQKR